MARKSKAEETRPITEPVQSDAQQALGQPVMPEAAPLSAMLVDALSSVSIGPAHGALAALETALTELKTRAIGVESHLREDYAPILDRIQSL